jgi:hypothetical protein
MLREKNQPDENKKINSQNGETSFHEVRMRRIFQYAWSEKGDEHLF